MPPYLRVVDLSACEKDWNSLPICSGVMPMPVSCTSKRSEQVPLALLRLADATTTRSPFSVNLTAFVGEVDQDLPEPQRVADQVVAAGRLDVDDSSRPFACRLLAR